MNAFPLNGAAAGQEAFTLPDPSSFYSPCVLIVDAHGDTRDLYRAALAHAGFEVLGAANGADAMSVASDALPDVIVTELRIGRVDGFELLSRLQQQARTRGIPVVVLTGWINASVPARVRDGGAAAFLMKPCAPDVLLAALHGILRRFAGGRSDVNGFEPA